MKIDPKLKIQGRLTIKKRKTNWFNKLINRLKRETPAKALKEVQDFNKQETRPCLNRPGGDHNYKVPVEEPRKELSLRDLLRK